MEIAFQYGITMVGLFVAMFVAMFFESLFQETKHTTISSIFGIINIILFFGIVTLMFAGISVVVPFTINWMMGK